MARKKLSLNSDWKFHLGEISSVHGNGHGDIYNMAKAGASAGVPQGDYDVSEWETVQLPHDWAIRQPFAKENVADWGYKSRGKGWYRKSFLLPREYQDKKLVLNFEGVATHCTVYFNGSIVARNYSGYVPFEVDISDMALFGEVPNVLAILVDADVWEGWWYEGAGIYRCVWLEVLNPVHIRKDSVFLYPKEGEGAIWNVQTSLEICNEEEIDREVTVQVEVTAPNKLSAGTYLEQILICPAGTTKFETQFSIEDPQLWDIDNPQLYQVKVVAEIEDEIRDSISTVCGFRTIEMDAEKGFFLNHRPIKLYGTCNHQDFGGLGVAVPDNLWEYRIEKLKEMGSNAYRCAHGMTSDALLEACDRLGMLVLAENRNFDSSKEGLNQLQKLVERQRNHPSVIMYSIFNEEPLQGTSQGKRMAKSMCSLIRRLDSGRLITGAMHGGILSDENAALELDVCGINYQTDGYDSFHEKYPQIPMVATETTSTFGVRGCYETKQELNEIASYDDDPSDWGNTVRETWKAVMERDYMAGAFMWTGFDYLGEPTPHVWPSVSSFFGLIDTCGFPKDGFYLAKAIFSKEAVCHVLPHWNHAGKEGQNIHVMSHTNCEEAELFVNGKSYGKKKVDLFTQATWEVPYEAGKIELVGYNAGIEVARDSKVTTGEAAAMEVIPWKKSVKGNGKDAMPVAIVAVDSEGREVPDVNIMTRIQVSGGRLLGACNGNPNCHEEFISEERSIFHGRCLAVVMPDKGVKQMEICVTALHKMDGETGNTGTERRFAESDGMFIGKAIIPVQEELLEEEIPSVTEYFLTQWKLSKVFDERPDVWMKMEDFDMNSWQDILVDKESGSPDIFENQEGKYIIYQIRTRIPREINGHLPILYFHSLWGECEIYLNGGKIGECRHDWPFEYSLELKKEDAGEAEIRVLVRNCNINAGLHSLVVLR